jgi:hypothetical protein
MPTKEEKNSFSLLIEEMAIAMGISHIEAITEHCSRTGLEVEIAGTLIAPTLKAKIEFEARELRYLTKESTLPV